MSDIDEQALRKARAHLGAKSLRKMVNRALRLAVGDHVAVTERLDTLADTDLQPRKRAQPGSVPIPEGKRGTPWDEVRRSTRRVRAERRH